MHWPVAVDVAEGARIPVPGEGCPSISGECGHADSRPRPSSSPARRPAATCPVQHHGCTGCGVRVTCCQASRSIYGMEIGVMFPPSCGCSREPWSVPYCSLEHVHFAHSELIIVLEPCPSGTALTWVGIRENHAFAGKARQFLESADEQNLDRFAEVRSGASNHSQQGRRSWRAAPQAQTLCAVPPAASLATLVVPPHLRKRNEGISQARHQVRAQVHRTAIKNGSCALSRVRGVRRNARSICHGFPCRPS